MRVSTSGCSGATTRRGTKNARGGTGYALTSDDIVLHEGQQLLVPTRRATKVVVQVEERIPATRHSQHIAGDQLGVTATKRCHDHASERTILRGRGVHDDAPTTHLNAQLACTTGQPALGIGTNVYYQRHVHTRVDQVEHRTIRIVVGRQHHGAAGVLDWMEDFLQTEWPDLDVWLTSVTEQWATVAVVGPQARAVMATLAPELDVTQDSFKFMQVEDAVVAGMPARVARISFSGELAFEINVPTTSGLAMWEAVFAAGEPYGITPYGTEAMHVLRAEKGYFIVGQETDGTVTPLDLGLDWMIADKEFVGRRSLRRSDMLRDDRKQLVGILPVDPNDRLPEGAQLIETAEYEIPVAMIGHVTSSYESAVMGRTFGLALVRGGRSRIGETIYAPLLDRTVAVELVDPIIFDAEGARRDG